jgi:trehalose/maltose hydrolase-like predicted phosphorylase
VLHFQPRLIDRLDGLAFSMQFRGTSIRISIKGHELTALAQAGGLRGPVRIAVGDQIRELGAGARCVFALPQPPDPVPR